MSPKIRRLQFELLTEVSMREWQHWPKASVSRDSVTMSSYLDILCI
jgi:hypothetical protein